MSSAVVGTIIVAVIAAVPGILSAVYSFRVRKDRKTHQVTDFGTELAQQAFTSMSSQVKHLVEEQARWDRDREQWERDRTAWSVVREQWATDKAALLSRIDEMTDRLRMTEHYLNIVIRLLDQHKIAPPAPPPGWRQPTLWPPSEETPNGTSSP